MNLLTKLFLPLFAIGIPFCCLAAPLATTETQTLVPSQLQKVLLDFQAEGGKINGSLLIAQDTDILFAQSYGTADVITHELNALHTQFLIGSVTKQFTAAAVLKSLYDKEKQYNPSLSEEQLTEKVKELLHRPLSYFLPHEDPIWQGNAPEWLDQVTPHHLLCHTSGIPNFLEDPSWEEFSQQTHSSLCEVVALFKDKQLDFTPGEKWQYSNSGFTLLGLVADRTSGVPLESYFQTYFFNPLEMASTFWPTSGRVPEIKKDHPHLARGYGWDVFDCEAPSREQSMYEEMLHAYAAGNLISTVGDLHRWNIALYKSLKVLPKSLMELMTTQHTEIIPNVYYAYGIFVQHKPELSVFCHHGDIPGYHAHLNFYPEHNVTFVSLSNMSVNCEQVSILMHDLKEKFGDLEESEQNYRLKEAYLKENYPAFFEQCRLHDFSTPLIQFIEKQLERVKE